MGKIYIISLPILIFMINICNFSLFCVWFEYYGNILLVLKLYVKLISRWSTVLLNTSRSSRTSLFDGGLTTTSASSPSLSPYYPSLFPVASFAIDWQIRCSEYSSDVWKSTVDIHPLLVRFVGEVGSVGNLKIKIETSNNQRENITFQNQFISELLPQKVSYLQFVFILRNLNFITEFFYNVFVHVRTVSDGFKFTKR